MEENQINFWETHFPDSKEREEAQNIYRHLTEIFVEKEKVTSFIRSLEKCAYLECISCGKKESRIQFCSGEGCEEIFGHYGLLLENTKNTRASGFDSEYFNRMCVIIGNVWKINSRARIILDYDPNYPKSIVRTEFFKD